MPTFSTAIANQYKSDLAAYEIKAKEHTITIAEANSARTIIANYYNYLDSVGIKYGAAAYDVSQNIGYFGGVANILLGNGIEAKYPSLNSTQVGLYRDSIMISLAFQDASLRTNSTIAPNGVLSYLDIDTYHVDKFNEYGIDLSYWGGYGFDKFDYAGSYMGLSGNDASYSYADKQLSYSNLIGAALSGEVTADGVSARDVFYNLIQADQEYKLAHIGDLAIGGAVAYFELVYTVNNLFLPAPINPFNSFSISNSVGTGAIWSNGLTADFASGIVATGGGWGLSLPGSTLNSDGLFHVAPSSFLSNGWRPGAFEPSDFDFSGDFGSGINWSDTNGAFYTPSLSINMGQFSTFGDINNYQSGSLFFLNIDPLVLDLTGAGIQLSNYSEANVLFNAANDNYKLTKYIA